MVKKALPASFTLTCRHPLCRKEFTASLDQLECSHCGWGTMPWKYKPPLFTLEPEVRKQLNALHDRESKRLQQMTSLQIWAWLQPDLTRGARIERYRRATGLRVRVSEMPVPRRPKKEERRQADPFEKIVGPPIDLDEYLRKAGTADTRARRARARAKG